MEKREEPMSVPPKKLALYQAVHDLLLEGEDLTRLKVSDIAARAGIGKGTTYEYFKSREELIIKSVIYYAEKNYNDVLDHLGRTPGFRNKMEVMMDYLFADNGTDKRFFEQLMLLFADHGSLPERFRAELGSCAPYRKKLSRLCQMLYADAVAEHIIEGQFCSYYMYAGFLNLALSCEIYNHPDRWMGKSLLEEGGEKTDREVLSEEKGILPCPPLPDKKQVRQRLYDNLVYTLKSSCF